MPQLVFDAFATTAIVVLFIAVAVVRGFGRGRPGRGAAGAVYGLLTADRQRAVDVVLKSSEGGDETSDRALPGGGRRSPQ
jgi:hypothetical protein